MPKHDVFASEIEQSCFHCLRFKKDKGKDTLGLPYILSSPLVHLDRLGSELGTESKSICRTSRTECSLCRLVLDDDHHEQTNTEASLHPLSFAG